MVNIDTKEDFEIELETETIQDYKDIYNIDLVRTLSEAIKQQIVLNKDFDVYLSNSFGFGGTNSAVIVKKYK